MYNSLIVCAFFTGFGNALTSLRGISPNDLEKYKPDDNGNWHCLNNPEIEISFDKVNDNYCDCPDGSDEPGTAACGNGLFFCENIGFESHFIPSYKIDDGICDYDVCCDGSDEAEGICENRCIEMKKKHDKEVDEHNKKIIDGLKIKNKLLEKSKFIKLDIENLIQNYRVEIKEIENELIKCEEERNKLDENQELIINNFKIIENDLDLLSDGLFNSFDKLNKYVVKLESLESILSKMSEEYNHNFNDPAVKQAAQDYFNFAASIKDQEEGKISIENTIDTLKESIAYLKKDIKQIRNEILNIDFENMKKKIDTTNDSTSTGTSSYLTFLLDILAKSCKQLVDSFLGVESHIIPYEEIEKYELASNDMILKDSGLKLDEKMKKLNERLNYLKSELNKKEDELNKDFGPDDILRSMSECIESKIGTYKYKLCLTSILEQINNDGRGTRIGNFKEIKYNDETGNYQIVFKGGERCWNGPVREAIVDVECGIKQDIVVVTEPEKCTYQMKFVSPIGCFESDLL